MFNLSAAEVLVILAAALIVLGPERLPGAARKIGQLMGQVRDLSLNFQREVHSAMSVPEASTEKPHSRPHLTAIDGGRSPSEPADAIDPVAIDDGGSSATAATTERYDAGGDGVDPGSENHGAGTVPGGDRERAAANDD